MNRKSLLLVACGTAAGLAAAASAQPYVINASGATLLENFMIAPAATNDYIDVDGNGIARRFGTNQQLAPFGLNPFPPDQHWIVQYRAVGSVNGFQELVDFGRTYVTTPDGVEIRSIEAERAFHNRTRYINTGVSSNAIFNPANPGAAPVRSTMDGAYTATYAGPGNPSAGGIQIDVAPVDVPAAWSVFTAGGTPDLNANPGAPGYGLNPRRSVNKEGGTAGADLSSFLADIGKLNLFNPANPGAADDKTIFDTPIAFAPIAPITNLGTGISQLSMSDIRHLTGTGRLLSGENLVSVTRDVGSGTRNGFMNSIGMDPSWGVGENIGGLSTLASWNILGPDFIPGNKGGTGGVEATTRNHRLAIGYVGPERGVNNGWLTGGTMEIVAVQNDIIGGTQYVRPTIQNVLNNDADGWVIGGPAIFAGIGDPLAAPVAKGGEPGNTNPQMRNVEAAAFLNNITRSIAAFVGNPGGNETFFTPGELLATRFILTAATDFVQDPLDPINLIPNPNFNPLLKDFIANQANNVLGNAVYQSFGTVTLNGKNPTRMTGVVYSDGVANGANYIDQAGNPVQYGVDLADRNRIAGDFNGDGLRNLDDALEMVRAWHSRNSGPAWIAPAGTGPIAGAPGADAVIEILGDFNGDGNFDIEDVRYWADGLAIDPLTGKLDRKQGFEAIDTAWQSISGNSNFFGTQIVGGRPYEIGDSRADVSNASGQTARGWAPVGADGIIDEHDLDYIRAQFINNPYVPGSEADWADLGQAVGFDLSADMTGDLKVNAADAAFVELLIGACYANCDGSTIAPVLNVDDFTCFINQFAAAQALPTSQQISAYANCDGSTIAPVLNVDDFTCFINQFALGCN